MSEAPPDIPLNILKFLLAAIVSTFVGIIGAPFATIFIVCVMINLFALLTVIIGDGGDAKFVSPLDLTHGDGWLFLSMVPFLPFGFLLAGGTTMLGLSFLMFPPKRAEAPPKPKRK